jgi:uncharacterized protein YbjT (DUF2867 family)
MPKTAIIFGVTGLTGHALLGNLLKDDRYSKVYCVTRKNLDIKHPKLEEVNFDFKNFDALSQIRADLVFCCLGTTIKKAGSKEAQQVIDRDYPIQVSKYAKKINAEKLVCVSSVGADKKSSNFYLRTKGEMESGVSVNFPGAVFVRPSFLLGNRKEQRIGEKIGIAVFSVISPLLLSGLKKYKGVNVKALSKVMINSCFRATPNILHYNDFVRLLK